MMKEETKRALAKCMSLCSKAEKCVSDIRKKLDQMQVPRDEASLIINELIDQRFIDEERYAAFYVRDKFRFNQWGRVKISYMLKGKGIASDLIERAFEQLSEEEYLNTVTELLSQKNRSVKAASEFERRAKLMRFGQARGFEMDLLAKVVDRLLV
ncbi:regulatory protein [Roseimarinus sediminis]